MSNELEKYKQELIDTHKALDILQEELKATYKFYLHFERKYKRSVINKLKLSSKITTASFWERLLYLFTRKL